MMARGSASFQWVGGDELKVLKLDYGNVQKDHTQDRTGPFDV